MKETPEDFAVNPVRLRNLMEEAMRPFRVFVEQDRTEMWGLVEALDPHYTGIHIRVPCKLSPCRLCGVDARSDCPDCQGTGQILVPDYERMGRAARSLVDSEVGLREQLSITRVMGVVQNETANREGNYGTPA